MTLLSCYAKTEACFASPLSLLTADVDRAVNGCPVRPSQGLAVILAERFARGCGGSGSRIGMRDPNPILTLDPGDPPPASVSLTSVFTALVALPALALRANPGGSATARRA